jgi:hypothetical protein
MEEIAFQPVSSNIPKPITPIEFIEEVPINWAKFGYIIEENQVNFLYKEGFIQLAIDELTTTSYVLHGIANATSTMDIIVDLLSIRDIDSFSVSFDHENKGNNGAVINSNVYISEDRINWTNINGAGGGYAAGLLFGYTISGVSQKFRYIKFNLSIQNDADSNGYVRLYEIFCFGKRNRYIPLGKELKEFY